MEINLESLSHWLPSIIAIPGAAYYITRILSHFRQRRRRSDSDPVDASSGSLKNDILEVSQDEPSNRPPAILSVVVISCSGVILAFGGFTLYLWISRQFTARIDSSFFYFIIVFVLFPLFNFADMFFIQPKRFRLGKSVVAKEASITFRTDAEQSFERCRVALQQIGGTIIRMQTPKLLKARVDKSIITVSISQREGSKAKAMILCDSQWLTVTFDGGANRKHLNMFLKKLAG